MARNARGNGGNCISALTRPVEWLDARELEGRPGKLSLSGRREMRILAGMGCVLRKVRLRGYSHIMG